MSESKHTPGPWRTSNSYGHVFTGDYKVICKMADNNPLLNWAVEGSSIENSANARLIAAAPELLSALKALFEHCSMVHNQWGDNCNQKQADAAIVAGRAAIVKAEGGAG